MKYPGFITNKSSIGFPAPSFGNGFEPYISAFNHMLEIMAEKGHRLIPGVNAYKCDGIGISTNPGDCGRELTDMYLDKDIDCLVSCGGGELMCETLDYVDFERIAKAEPKWFMGYSDNTNFTFTLATMCDVASVYGPCAGTFGMEPWHESLNNCYALLKGEKREFNSFDKWEKESLKDAEHPFAPINATEDRLHAYYYNNSFFEKGTEADVSFEFKGRMIGGCIDILITLLGTNYDHVREFNDKYSQDGIVWVLEACDLNVFAIRRAMWQMKHAGWFENVKGFIIGRPANGADMMNLNRFSAVIDVLSEYKVPIIMDADIGHCAPMLPVVMGAIGQVRVNGNDMNIEYYFE